MVANLRTTDTPAGLGAHELVLLHGQPGSPADWQLVAGRLPAPLHAVATDRPGYGSSGLPAGGFAVNARAVLDDLDSHGIARAVLVGHSFGGGVALSAASLAPCASSTSWSAPSRRYRRRFWCSPTPRTPWFPSRPSAA